MTPAEELRAAFIADDEAAVRGLLEDLSEADRAVLITVAREIVASVKKLAVLDAVRHLAPMLLIAFGTLPVSEIRKLGWRSNHSPSRLEDVLRRRAPERLNPIVEYLVDDVGGAWPCVRTLVREGIVPRPDRPSYTIAMLAATRYRDPAEVIAEDPGLLEVEVWRLFEVEGGGEDSLANHEKFFGDRWGVVFRDLAARDPAMRARLLDLSLSALARDFAQYRAGWFSRFHESLAPTDSERVQRAAAYLGLLRSRVGPTVSFAVAALTTTERAGGLPADLVLDRIGPVLVEGSAGTAKAGLALVARAGAGSRDDARRPAIVAADALANASAEVQRAAIVLIDRLVREPDDSVATTVAARFPEVAASQQAAAAALVARLGGGEVPVAPPSPVLAEVVPGAPRRSSPIDLVRSIEPVGSIEALVDLAVSVLETGEPADEVERVLDAVGRLAGDRPADFTRLTAPIVRRARAILARRESRPFTGFDAKADIAAVLLAWAGGELVTPEDAQGSGDSGAGAFLSARAREVAAAAAGGRAFVSVAAPTHAGGWLDPSVLVRRLGVGPPASTIDLVAAILRLAPDRRADALGWATDLIGEAGAAVRYALGGAEPIGPTGAWWVAAARVRAPGEDDLAVEARHPRLGPDAGQAARVRIVAGKSDIWRFRAGLGLEIQPAPNDATPLDLPTVLMLRDPSSFYWAGQRGPAMFRWMATIQPGYCETWAAVGSLLIGRNVDWWSAEWANRAFLETFLDPATSIGPHARALLGIALGAKEAGERGVAADVIGLALRDGRSNPSDLAEGLTAAAAIDCDRPNRWAISLADVASQSDAHAAAVAEAVARSLPALAERPPAKLVPLLRLLDELLARTGAPPAAAAHPLLDRLAGAGGQAGRLARSIRSRG